METLTATATQKLAAGDDQSLRGDLQQWPLPEMLLYLHQGRRSAMLRIGRGLDAAVVFFDRGTLFRCEWGHLDGEQALMALLSLQGGEFTLIQRDLPRPRANIRLPTPQLLQSLGVLHTVRARAAGF